MATKIIATHEGVTATRKSERPYTHAVFGLSLVSQRIGYYLEALSAKRRAEEPGAEWIARFENAVANNRARGDVWVAVSWHQGPVNAAKGLEAARRLSNKYGRVYDRVALVEVEK
jgi:hypothetical protein